MGRLSLLLARVQPRRPEPEGAPPAAAVQEEAAATPAAPRQRPVASPGMLRRERRALARAREERIRDLGGILLEMYRRDRFRQDLVAERCEELTELDGRLEEIDSLLALNVAGRRLTPTGRCVCGAPTLWGSHFCANCGRSTGQPVVACETCEHPLPADSRFCAACGSRVGSGPPAPEPAGAQAVATVGESTEEVEAVQQGPEASGQTSQP